MPITLWVDVKRRKYLIDQAGKRSGYRFWSVEFKTYPQFDNPEDIPVIELAANRHVEEILPPFVEALTCYFAWLAGKKCLGFNVDSIFVESILQRYSQET